MRGGAVYANCPRRRNREHPESVQPNRGARDRAERRMKIGTKLFLYHLIPLIVLMTLFAYLEQRRARTVLSVEVAREGRVLTRTIQIAVQDAVRDRQLEDVHTLVDR